MGIIKIDVIPVNIIIDFNNVSRVVSLMLFSVFLQWCGQALVVDFRKRIVRNAKMFTVIT